MSAYVSYPMRGQALKLELPPGVELVAGKEMQPVPQASEGPPLGLVVAPYATALALAVRPHAALDNLAVLRA